MKVEVVVDGKVDIIFVKILGVIGSLLFIVGVILLKFCNCFLIRKFWVKFW